MYMYHYIAFASYTRCDATVSELTEEKLFIKKSKDLANRHELQPFCGTRTN